MLESSAPVKERKSCSQTFGGLDGLGCFFFCMFLTPLVMVGNQSSQILIKEVETERFEFQIESRHGRIDQFT